MQPTNTAAAVTPGTAAQGHEPYVAAGRRLWIGAVLTATAAVFFPRLNAVIHGGQRPWEIDAEAAVLIPVIVVVTLALFGAVATPAWRSNRSSNRPATVGLACGILAPVGILAFFVSAPIILGGLATTLGLEGRRRAAVQGGSRKALAAIALGIAGVLLGAGVWLIDP